MSESHDTYTIHAFPPPHKKKKLRNGICVLKRFVSRNLNTKSLKLYSVMLVLHAPTHMQNKADNKHAKPIRYHSALSIRE